MKIKLRAHSDDPGSVELWQDECLYAVVNSDMFVDSPFGDRLEAGEEIEFELVEAEQ